MKRKGLSIRTKMYLFLIVTILSVSIGTALLAYRINVRQIDKSYRQITSDTARTFASFVDGDYLERLRKAAESDEYQALREKAEAEDDESMIESYLRENNLWDNYSSILFDLRHYIENMKSVKYLYIVACGDANSNWDMYLIDGDDVGIYEAGYYEDREEDLKGTDFSVEVEPSISHGDWGWLCSAYTPVKNSKGEVVAQVGCDFDMEDVMEERQQLLLYIIIIAIIFTAIVIVVAVLLINKMIVHPINSITGEMKKFKPTVHAGYEESGVIDLDIKNRDEIGVLYEGIHSMETDIVDYLNDLDVLKHDNEDKDRKIGQISKDAYKDALTGVGSKSAYMKRVEEINVEISNGQLDFGIVMVDMNDLKMINDKYGHKMGDSYLKGCCHIICETFKHSPVYRIGGDEFVVILTGEDYNDRFNKVNQLKEEYVKSRTNENAKPWQKYSASVGMAELAFDDATLEFVFKRADRKMYEDKQKFKQENGSYR